MNIIGIFVGLIVIGVALYLVNQYIPMAAPIKTIINVVAILIIVVWLLHMSGLFPGMSSPVLTR